MRDDLIYGIHAIQSLLDRNPEQILEVFIVDSRDEQRLSSIISQSKSQKIALTILTKKQLDNWLPDATHQGVAAKIRPPRLLSLDELLENISPLKTKPLLLVLDGVQDPHNLGACLRTADAAGVTAVIIPKDKAAGITPIVRKVASGAAETVPIVQVTNLVRALEQLKEQGIWILGTSATAKQSVFAMDFKSSVALVLGAEGTGLRRLTEAHCDVLMHIPMAGVVESLNVSVAAGICLYEAVRQRI